MIPLTNRPSIKNNSINLNKGTSNHSRLHISAQSSCYKSFAFLHDIAFLGLDIVIVTDDTEWQTSFSRVIKEYPDLHEKSIYSSYDNVDIKEISHIHCAVVNIDLATSCKQSYEAIRSFVFSYNPKRPVSLFRIRLPILLVNND